MKSGADFCLRYLPVWTGNCCCCSTFIPYLLVSSQQKDSRTIFPSWVSYVLRYTRLTTVWQRTVNRTTYFLKHIEINSAFDYLCVLFLAEKHSLKYFLSASSGLTNLPEFVAHMVVDNLQGGYCDSNGKIPKPRDDWAVKMIHEDPKQLELYANECVRYQHTYRAHIENIKQQFNQSGGMISKRIYLVTVMLAKSNIS